MNILIRVDVSEQIGFGHLDRSIKISKFFKAKKVIFLVNSSNKKIYNILRKKKINFKILNSKKNIIKSFEKVENKNLQLLDAKETIKIAKKNNVKLILVDDYKKNYLWHKVIINNKIYLVIIDDLNNKKVLCDLYINLNKKKEQINKSFLLKKSKLICGHSNNPFLFKNIEKKYLNKMDRVHLSLSSSVNKKILIIIIKTLNNFQKKNKPNSKLNLNIFSTSYDFSVFKRLKFNFLKIRYFNDSKKYINDMKKSDLGIGFAGMSMFDRMSYLLPSINFSISKNQDISLKDQYLRKFMYAGNLKTKYFDLEIKKNIEFFLKNEKLRKKIFDNLNNLPKKENFKLNIKLEKIIHEIKFNRNL